MYRLLPPASADRAVFVQASQARTVQFTKTPKTPEGQDIPIPTIPEQYKDQVESPFVDQPRSATVSTPTFGVDTERGPSPSQASEIRSSVSGSIFSSSGLSTTDLNHSSDSQFSSRSGSMLEGIPFFGQPPTPSSPLFPMPPSHKGSVPTQANSTVGVNVQTRFRWYSNSYQSQFYHEPFPGLGSFRCYFPLTYQSNHFGRSKYPIGLRFSFRRYPL